jgi:hypothetical protein
MIDPVDRPDPDRIWLEPACCADPSEGRCWAPHNVWPNGDCDIQAPGVEYIRADLVAAREAAVRAQVWEEAAEIAEKRHEVWHNQDPLLCEVEDDETACQDIAGAIRARAEKEPKK